MDIFRCAVAITVVIYAILNRAIDALDVLFALSLFTIRHNYDRPLFLFRKHYRRFRGAVMRSGFRPRLYYVRHTSLLFKNAR